ncbi:hypothetical protein SAMN05444161_7059 [Rhizobiales bacterium GAS191]|nr:hypothetical protein SAMN05444161_7059 [Rhizobiales bacterium GAS191]
MSLDDDDFADSGFFNVAEIAGSASLSVQIALVKRDHPGEDFAKLKAARLSRLGA